MRESLHVAILKYPVPQKYFDICPMHGVLNISVYDTSRFWDFAQVIRGGLLC